MTTRIRNLLASLGASCRQCGSSTDLDVDHRIPRELGGSDNPSNLQVLCRSCHIIKTSQDSRKWNIPVKILCEIQGVIDPWSQNRARRMKRTLSIEEEKKLLDKSMKR